MKKKLLSLLLCLSFVLALVPTAAMAVDGAAAAGDTLTPADLYYNFNGSVATEPGEPNITLSKTATTTDGETFNVTLTAKAQKNVKIVAPEVTFVLDASRSMESKNGTSTRWDVAKSAVATMDTNLGKDVTKNYVYFNLGAGTATDSSYSGVTISEGTNLVAGVAAGMTAFQVTGGKKVLIIVSDGEANNGEPSRAPSPECYPTKLIDEFKKAGGVVYTVGFSFDGDSTAFMALASDENCQFLANNAQELNVAMDKIATKINGLIIDPMGENVELVSNVTVNEAYKTSSLNVVDNTIFWNNADGLAEPVTLTYQVKIKQTVLNQVKTADKGLDVYLNGNATLNYTYGGSDIAVAFPKPYVRLDPEPKMCTLTYVSNGGTEFTPDRVKAGTLVTLTNIPTQSGYQFTGWYSDAELTTLVTEVTMDTDKTVYAGWKEDEAPDLEKCDHSAYIVGYEDGTVRPENNITRAEVAAIFYRLLTDDARAEGWATTNSFPDVESGFWYSNGISTLANMGILSGYEDGSFRPDAYVTRAEFATIAAKFSGGPADEYADFEDVPKTHWASKYIAKAASLGWITGDGDGNFRPEAYITRAEAMSLVNRVLERGVDKEGLSEDAIQWPDNKSGDWYYYDVLEATNSHVYTRTDRPLKKRLFCAENWVELKENRDWKAMEAEWEKLYGKN